MRARLVIDGVLVALFGCLAFSAAAVGCGVRGHGAINSNAVRALAFLPDASKLYEFYRGEAGFLASHSSDADIAAARDPRLTAEHYMVIDSYNSGMGNDQQLDKTAMRYYGQLINAFKSGNRGAILFSSANLGHFVGDLHLAFHLVGFNVTDQDRNAIHARYRSDAFMAKMNESAIQTSHPELIANPQAAMVSWARESLPTLSTVLEADKIARQQDARFTSVYYTVFAQRSMAVTERQVSKAATDTASLFYSAWVQAGRPNLPI